MIHRIFANWVYGGFLAGLLLLLLAPLFICAWPATLAAAFFCLPAYMLHQYEEHDNDRFRVFVNRLLGNGREVLTVPAVFMINVPGVWGVMVVAFWLAARVDPGLVLIAVYLPLINAVIHITQAAVARSYNPGLVSAVVIFLPLCIWCLVVVQRSGYGPPTMHAVGVAAAVAIHAIIIIPVLRNRQKFA